MAVSRAAGGPIHAHGVVRRVQSKVVGKCAVHQYATSYGKVRTEIQVRYEMGKNNLNGYRDERVVVITSTGITGR